MPDPASQVAQDLLHAVSVVALSREDSLGDFETLIGRNETDDIGETRVGRLHRADYRESRRQT